MNTEFKMPSEGQIAKWKKEHGTLHVIRVNDAMCIVRSPKVTDISQSATMGEGDEVKIGLIQLKNCWLAGDNRILNKLAYQQAAAKQMGLIFEVYPFHVETAKVTKDLIAKLTAQGVKEEVIKAVEAEGTVRRVEVTLGAKPQIENGNDTRLKIEALFHEPDLKVKEKADLVADFLDQGSVYVNECFLAGDQRFTDHSDEHIAFASYMAGHQLVERFTASVEKL